MRWLLIGVLVVAPLGLVSCDQLGDIDPVETACALCDMINESGVCSVISSLKAEKCEEGEELVFTNLGAALRDGVPLETACR